MEPTLEQNALLPIIEELAGAPNDAARATWLLSCPLAILMTYQTTIRARLRNAGFLYGVDYLEVELARMRSVRSHGSFMMDNPARQKMFEISMGSDLPNETGE